MQHYIKKVVALLFGTRRRVYPTLANAVQLTGTTTTWSFGSYVEVVPVSTITSNFRILEIVVEAVSASIECQIDIATGAASSEVVIFTARFVGTCRIQVPCDTISANTRISARLANKGTTGRTADISIGFITE